MGAKQKVSKKVAKMEKVVAVRDLWTDGKDRLLVLSGTQGKIIEERAAEGNKPHVFGVAFADGQSCYCTADEICEMDNFPVQ